MIELVTRGGLAVESFIEETLSRQIHNASLPGITILPLLQYQGQIRQWKITPGDRVGELQVVATGPDGNLHSPVPGLVERIWDITLPDGRVTPAAQIRLEGGFTRTSQALHPLSWESLSPSELLMRLKNLGVLFQASTLGSLGPIREEGAVRLIINAVQPQPYLTLPHHFLLHFQREIREAVLIMQHIYRPASTVLALCSESFPLVDENDAPFEVAQVKNIYPSAQEDLLRAEMAPDLEASQVLMVNLETLYWIYDAVVWNKPVTERLVVFAGKAFERGGVIKVRIGTPVADMIQDCGGFAQTPQAIIFGGPFLGAPVKELWLPVTMETPGILGLSKYEVKPSREMDCIRCGVCISHCPVGLHPVDLYFNIEFGEFQDKSRTLISKCIECGICSFVCPSRIPLKEMFSREKTGGGAK